MLNKDVKVGMSVRVQGVAGPWMLVVAKTPGIVGSAVVSCIWFTTDHIQQTGVFHASSLENSKEFSARLNSITGR